jgi:hypothetical protein
MRLSVAATAVVTTLLLNGCDTLAGDRSLFEPPKAKGPVTEHLKTGKPLKIEEPKRGAPKPFVSDLPTQS